MIISLIESLKYVTDHHEVNEKERKPPVIERIVGTGQMIQLQKVQRREAVQASSAVAFCSAWTHFVRLRTDCVVSATRCAKRSEQMVGSTAFDSGSTAFDSISAAFDSVSAAFDSVSTTFDSLERGSSSLSV